MTALRVLVVDDQHDVRRVLAAGIRTLGAEIDVVDVPSGEEAQLEASRHPLDLLITDVRLPGISGLELVTRIRKRSEDMKVILVTGVEEQSVRRQIAEAGAEAFFYKPIHMADFLNAVEHSLGLKDAGFVSPPAPHDHEGEDDIIVASPPSIKWISDLRQELDALAVILVDILGQVEARAGDLPNPVDESEWLTVISLVLTNNVKLSNFIKAGKPTGFLYLNGSEYHLCLTHLGKSHAALIITKQSLESAQFQIIQDYSRLLDMDVQALKIEQEELEEVPLEETQSDSLDEDEIPLDELSSEDLPALEALFSQSEEMKAQDIDSFWDTLSDEDSSAEAAFGGKTLTYEQALKLGLAPGEEDADQEDNGDEKPEEEKSTRKTRRRRSSRSSE